MRRLRLVLIAIILGCVLRGHLAAEPNGSISGTVIDENGKPVSSALVRVDPINEGPRSGIVRQTETDKAGHFFIDTLQLDSYKVFAMKESDGYPNTAFAFYSNQAFSTVTLLEGAPSTTLVLKVGPRAGLMTGTVADLITGKPVNSTFLLRRAADSDNWISFSQPSEYRVLVPPNTDVVFEVSAPGYETFYYGGNLDSLRRQPIHLNSLQEMKVNIQLRPTRSVSSN